jgi:hypothetical protein
MGFDRFEYHNNGEWTLDDAVSTSTGLFDTDTSEAGALLRITRTGEDSYDVLVDSFGAAADFSASRTFRNPGTPVDWIEFVFFNPASDTGSPPTDATDLYIRSMEIIFRLPGDANFDGKIDADDYFLIDRGFSHHLQGYENGDFDGNGKVDADDYFIIDKSFALQHAPSPIAVPEPASILILSLAFMAVGHRNRISVGRRASGTI